MEKCISFLQRCSEVSYLLFLWFGTFVFTFIPTSSCENCLYAGEGETSLRNLVFSTHLSGFYNIFQLGCFEFVNSAWSCASHPCRDLLIFSRSYSELLGAPRCTDTNRDLLIFARSYSKLLGVARSCALHPYRAISSLLGVTRSCSEQLCCCQLLPLQHTGACSYLLGEKRYLTNPTRNVLTGTVYKVKTSQLEYIVKARQMC